ncbi:hypothetical protein Salmuc_03212 [Salipiger mucosus DSM 16094]|uniref:YknX-like C-terminal permuted SH3-like domain-containing protein n=1 Tax=Salipiger mucosus DSM 16094 TaxID=1123237 RepID=S9Q7S2_9RHOB|nr:hypothetical protein Salmuc_03212 [Salipiger mucosus DSM 16094]
MAMREAEVSNAQAQLIGFDGPATSAAIGGALAEDIPLVAPISGQILQVIQESETILPAGAPVIEVGDVAGDLEVVAELISSDAVQVAPGDRAIVADWGGDPLAAEVTRVAPRGETKVSALGVEEQRVTVTARFTGPLEARAGLGHGFRVVLRIVTWESDEALRLPSSALFRNGGDWAVFRAVEGRAVLTPVATGPGNGTATQVVSGLDEGARVVLYPGADLVDGARIAPRGGA